MNVLHNITQELMRMRCAWQELLKLLPIWMRGDVDTLGAETLQELRLRLKYKPVLIRSNGNVCLDREIHMEDLLFCINTASKYSPWTTGSIQDGYITAPGGHRIGICGQASVENGHMTGISVISSLCIRISRDFIGISRSLEELSGSILILGKPGSGKTTLLRDIIRGRSVKNTGSIGVVDQKCEIFPHVNGTSCFETGLNTDVMYNCSKPYGIDAILRNMGPDTIAVDEITAEEDCKALLRAGWCGVDILATAHAGSISDLYSRPVYKSIVDSKLFNKAIVLRPDKTWSIERIKL